MKATINLMLSGTYRVQTYDYVHQMIIGKGKTIEEAKTDLLNQIESTKNTFKERGLRIPPQLLEKIVYIDLTKP